jgi:RNA polymerase sigma-70 factor, ECF subfamily
MLFRTDPLAHAERLIPKVYAYVAYQFGDGPEAEDVTSEVFERALRYRKSYDSTKGEPIAWLIGIARRVLSESNDRRREGAVSGEEAAARNLEDDVVGRLTLAAAFAALDSRERELIVLKYGAGLSTRQISEVTGTREGTIDVALHRARERLRRTLAEAS